MQIDRPVNGDSHGSELLESFRVSYGDPAIPWGAGSSTSDLDLEKHLIDNADAVFETGNSVSDTDSIGVDTLYEMIGQLEVAIIDWHSRRALSSIPES